MTPARLCGSSEVASAHTVASSSGNAHWLYQVQGQQARAAGRSPPLNVQEESGQQRPLRRHRAWASGISPPDCFRTAGESARRLRPLRHRLGAWLNMTAVCEGVSGEIGTRSMDRGQQAAVPSVGGPRAGH